MTHTPVHGALRVTGWAARVFEAVGMGMVVLMALNVSLDVALRSIANQPIQGTLELMAYWYMVAISFVGLWLAEVKLEHISVTMITGRLNAASRRVIQTFSSLITIAFVFLLGWYGLKHALFYMEQREFVGAFHIPVWHMRFIVVIGLFAYAGTAAYHALTNQYPSTGESDADDLTEEVEAHV